ncbi:PEP-CTERM sorting domain-containing protein [Paenibacillus sp. JMULE4]|nr:PEP-CTERM sorting domain-containing protein [Paenibacillus sp. JMULE4]
MRLAPEPSKLILFILLLSLFTVNYPRL